MKRAGPKQVTIEFEPDMRVQQVKTKGGAGDQRVVDIYNTLYQSMCHYIPDQFEAMPDPTKLRVPSKETAQAAGISVEEIKQSKRKMVLSLTRKRSIANAVIDWATRLQAAKTPQDRAAIMKESVDKAGKKLLQFIKTTPEVR